MSRINELFKKELKVANIGIESFYQDLKGQKVQAVHLNWKPVAGGNKKLAAMLDLLK